MCTLSLCVFRCPGLSSFVSLVYWSTTERCMMIAFSYSVLGGRINTFVFFFFFLQFLVKPRIAPFEFGQPIFAGVTTQVTCLVSEGDEPLDIKWSLHGSDTLTELGISTSKVGPKISILIIDTTTVDHGGNYTCTARNRAGSTNYTAALNINGKERTARQLRTSNLIDNVSLRRAICNTLNVIYLYIYGMVSYGPYT